MTTLIGSARRSAIPASLFHYASVATSINEDLRAEADRCARILAAFTEHCDLVGRLKTSSGAWIDEHLARKLGIHVTSVVPRDDAVRIVGTAFLLADVNGGPVQLALDAWIYSLLLNLLPYAGTATAPPVPFQTADNDDSRFVESFIQWLVAIPGWLWQRGMIVLAVMDGPAQRFIERLLPEDRSGLVERVTIESSAGVDLVAARLPLKLEEKRSITIIRNLDGTYNVTIQGSLVPGAGISEANTTMPLTGEITLQFNPKTRGDMTQMLASVVALSPVFAPENIRGVKGAFARELNLSAPFGKKDAAAIKVSGEQGASIKRNNSGQIELTSSVSLSGSGEVTSKSFKLDRGIQGTVMMERSINLDTHKTSVTVTVSFTDQRGKAIDLQKLSQFFPQEVVSAELKAAAYSKASLEFKLNQPEETISTL